MSEKPTASLVTQVSTPALAVPHVRRSQYSLHYCIIHIHHSLPSMLHSTLPLVSAVLYAKARSATHRRLQFLTFPPNISHNPALYTNKAMYTNKLDDTRCDNGVRPLSHRDTHSPSFGATEPVSGDHTHRLCNCASTYPIVNPAISA